MAKTVAKKAAKAKAPAKEKVVRKTGAPKLLSGENPQIPKGYGDGPVQAYIAAIPGWKRDVAARLDALITGTIPRVKKAVKWNSPFYGVSDNVYFLSFHCFTKYVKVAFFNGASLKPPPPGTSKQKNVRYLDIHEGDAINETQFTSWLKQSTKFPGEKM